MEVLRRVAAAGVALSVVAACASAPPPAARPTLAGAIPHLFAMSGSRVVGDLYCPDGDAPVPLAVLLLGGSEGGASWSGNGSHVQRLLDAGFCAYSLAYFGLPGLPAHLADVPVEYVGWATASLRSFARTRDATLAVVGGSRGAELALLAASRYPSLKAVVAIAPPAVAFPSPPASAADALFQRPAWTWAGAPVPYLRIPLTPAALTGVTGGSQLAMFEEALRDEATVDAASIPVERVNGPILLVSNTLDDVWPSTAMAERIVTRLEAKGFPFGYRHVRYVSPHNWCGLEPCWSEVVAFLRAAAPAAR